MGKQAKARPKAKAIDESQTLHSLQKECIVAQGEEGAGQDDRASEGSRPREAEAVEVRSVVPCWDEALPDPVPLPREQQYIREKQSSEVEPRKTWPIHKQNREAYNWVAQCSPNTYTTAPSRMMLISQRYDEVTCDVCGANCSRKLYRFRCFKKTHEMTEEDRHKGRVLEPFIAYISDKCAHGLLGHRRTAAGIMREWIRCDLLPQPLAKAKGELVGLRAFQKKAVMQELAEARDNNKKINQAAKFQQLKQQGRDLSLGPLATLRAADDQLISESPPAGMSVQEHVLQVLKAITWPDCTSRKNVMQEGVPKIKAMCLGCTKPRYRKELCISRASQTMPNLTKLIARLGAELPENFRWTSVQLNKGKSAAEAARFHRDKNNWGWSFIIGLGFYEDGTLFLACEEPGEEGDYEITLPEGQKAPAGYRPGQAVKGRLLDIHNKWQTFDGRTGHKAMDFKGERYSLVFFTRKEAHEQMPDEVSARLRDLGFRVPEKKWFQESEPKSTQRPVKQAKMERPEELDSDSSDDEHEDGSEGLELEMPAVTPEAGKDALQTSHRAQQLLDFLHQQAEHRDGKDKSSFPDSVPPSVQTAVAERGQEMQDEAKEGDSLLRNADDDVEDWEKRQRKLGLFYMQNPRLTFDLAMRWTFQAAMWQEKWQEKWYADVLLKGLGFMNNCLGLAIHQDSLHRPNANMLDKGLTGLEKFRGQFLQGMERKVNGWDEKIQKEYAKFKNLSFVHRFITGMESREGRYKLDKDKDMEIYVQDVLVPVKASRLPRAAWLLLQDFTAGWKKIGADLKDDFAAWEGPAHLSEVLQQVIKEDVKGRKKGEVKALVLTLPLDSTLQRARGLLRCCLQMTSQTFAGPAGDAIFAKIEAETWRHCSELVKSSAEAEKSPEDGSKHKPQNAKIQETISFLQDFHGMAEQQLQSRAKRLHFTAEFLTKLMQAKESIEDKARPLQGEIEKLQDLLANIRSLVGRRDELHRQLPEASQELAKSLRVVEDAWSNEVAAKAQSKLETAQHQLRDAQQAESDARLQQLLQEKQQEAQEAFGRLQAMIIFEESGGEKQPRLANLDDEFLQVMKECVALKKWFQSTLKDQFLHEQSLEQAKAAAKHWQEAPAVKQRLKAVLLENFLPLCLVDSLEKVGWLERLHQLNAEVLADQKWFGFLPKGIIESLLGCVKDGKFKAVEPKLPQGYKRVTSKTYELVYMHASEPVPSAQSGFTWPLEELPQEVEISAPKEPEHLERHDDQTAKYINGRPKHRWCYLCGHYCDPEEQHQELRRHAQRKEQWDQLSECLRTLLVNVKNANLADHCAARPTMAEDILKLWQFEIFTRMKKTEEALDEKDSPVLSCFWHLVLEPCNLSSPEKLQQFLEERLKLSQLPEPDMLNYPVPPRPGEDFPLFPPSSLDLANLPERLEPLQMLSEGLLLKSDGQVVECAFCETTMDSDPYTIRQHLKIKGKSAKGPNHGKNKYAWEEAVKTLQQGWLLEANGIRMGKTWRCECGINDKALYDLSKDHLGEKKHREWLHRTGHRASQAVQQKWKTRWETDFGAMCHEHLERLRHSELPLWEQHVGNAAPAAMETDGLAAPASSASTWPEPELPQPGKDFPDFSTGKMIQDNMCLCCGVAASAGHEQTPTHGRNKQRSLAVFRIIQQRGHQFWRDGITLQDHKASCKCGKALNSWWELESWFDSEHPHVKTKHHEKWVRNSDQPPADELPWEEPRRLRWEKSFAAQATADVESRTGPPRTPSPKRRKTEAAAESSQPSGASGDASGASPSRNMDKAKGFAPPSSEHVKYYTDEVNKRYFPELKGPLCWGWAKFKKETKEGWVYCQQCKVYVAVVTWDGQTTCTLSGDSNARGQCAHRDQLHGLKGLN